MGIIFSRDLTNPHQNMFSISASANAVVCSVNKTTKRSTKVVSKNNTAKNAALLAATIATISTSGAALADDIEDVYAAAYAQNRSFGVVSPEHSAIDDANARKASSPMKKEGGGLPFSLPSIEIPSVSLPSLPSLGGDAPADAPAAEE